MARLRFPGRPGNRFGRKYVKYTYIDMKLHAEKYKKESCGESIQSTSSQHRCFIEEQETKSFDGHSTLSVKCPSTSKTENKETVVKHRKSNSIKNNRITKKQKLATVFECSGLTYSNCFKRNKLRDFLSKSVKKLLKGSLRHHHKGDFSEGKENCRASMSFDNPLPDSKVNSPIVCFSDSNVNSNPLEPCLDKNDSCDTEKPGAHGKSTASTDPKLDFKNSVETMIMKRLLQKAKQSYDSQSKPHQQQNQTGRAAKKKLRRRYKSSKRKSKDLPINQISKCNDSLSAKVVSKSLPPITDSSPLAPLSIEVGNLKALNQNASLNDETQPIILKRHSMVLGRKKFTLPIVSARSSRRIFPQKRYLQEEELDVPSKRNSALDESLSSVSLVNKNNHMANCNRSKKRGRGQHISASNCLLLADGKRPWKSASKVALSRKNTSFGLQKNRSTGCLTSGMSASNSEFIKPDMVSKYADKMAEKPKERRLKNGDGKKSLLQNPDESIVIEKEKLDLPGKKVIDPLERIAAKIEKILRSQWEGRLNQTNAIPAPVPKPESPQTMKAKTSPLSQWKSEQEQRACDRKRTKNLIRKAKLQLKKRTLMKLRQPQSIALLNEQLQQPNSKIGAFSDKQPTLCSSPSLDWTNVPSIELKKSPVPPKFDVPGTKACCVCGLSTTISQVQKYYGQFACDSCSKFFGNFIETPKQYFCPKEGNCRSNVKAARNNKISSLRYRCKACWLRSCMRSFSVSAFLREHLLKYVPRLETPPHKPLIDDSNALSKISNVVDFAPSGSVSRVVDPESSKKNLPILEVCPQSAGQTGQNFNKGIKSNDFLSKGTHGTCKSSEFLVTSQDSSISLLNSAHGASSIETIEPIAAKTTVSHGIENPASLSINKAGGDDDMAEASGSMTKTNEKDARMSEANETTTVSPKNDCVNAPSPVVNEIGLFHCEAEEMEVLPSISEESRISKPEEIKVPLPGPDESTTPLLEAEEAKTPLPKIEEVKALLLKVVDDKPRGPRVKHVCRRAAVVLGLPKATFTQPGSKKHFNLSALPHDEKQKLLATETDTLKVETKASKMTKSGTSISTETTKMKVSIGISKKTSLTIQKKQKKKKLLLKKSFKHFHNHSFKKPMKLTRKLLIKNQLKYSYKRLNKPVAAPLKLPAKCIPKTPKFRKVRCKQCEGCLADDCAQCSYCLDKKKFGGPNLIKQACMFRRCLRPMAPASEKKAALAIKNNEEPTSFDHMNTDSRSEDSVLGIGPSLLNSSCSPSLSPDNSSCGSSCSSSSSSSSSGSSSSSSDSNSSSSNDSSNSKHSNSSNNNSSSHCSNMDSIDKDSSEVRNNNSQPSFLYETTFNNGFAVDFDAASSQTNFVNSVDLPLSESTVDAESSECSGSSCPGKGLYNKSKKTPARQPLQEKGKDYVNWNENDGSEDEDKDKKHLIVADYWVGRNTEKIFNVGYALITSEPLPLRSVCFLCGSAGEENLIYCAVCCEPYHLFCAGEQALPKNIEDWCCPKCQTCKVCGLKYKLLKCNECQNAYHTDCLGSFYPSKPSKKKKIWVCPKCVKCKSCGTTNPSPSSSVGWNFDLLLCHSCTRLKDKGNFCPLCHKCYEDDDYDSDMMQCSKCCVWVHAKCERMTDEEYQILSVLPETIVYTCFNCTVDFPPIWKLAVGNAFDSGLKSVMYTLLNSKCMKHLVSRKVENEQLASNCSSNSLLNICLGNPVTEKEGESIQDPELVKMDPCLPAPSPTCDNLTIETSLHKTAGVLERPFLSASSHCLEFSSPISSKSSVVDSGIDCDNSEGDMEKNEVTVQLSEQSDVAFISAPTSNVNVSYKVDGNSSIVTDTSSLPNTTIWSSKDHKLASECTKVKISCDNLVSRQSCNVESNNGLVEHFDTESVVKQVDMPKTLCTSKTRNLDITDLVTVKRKLSCRKYKSVSAFVNDVVIVIDSQEEGKKENDHIARSFFSKLIERTFPWFEVRDSKLWDIDEIHLPSDLLPHAVMPPFSDHTYAEYLTPTEPIDIPQPSTLKALQGDLRKCALCRAIGDDIEKERGRLLYCGQDDWIHLNCALWSAEVFQENDGLLKNVYSAISRGKLMRCENCNEYGATVGCCVRGCPSNYHYQCARRASAIFQTDKKVFCEEHKYCKDAPIMKDEDFQVRQCVYINQEDIRPKWVKKSWQCGQEIGNTHIVIGSLTVENLGYLSAVSDEMEHLIPVNFVCSRVFWSIKNPSQRVIYTCRTIEVLPDIAPVDLLETENLTISHDLDTSLIEVESCPSVCLNNSNQSLLAPAHTECKFLSRELLVSDGEASNFESLSPIKASHSKNDRTNAESSGAFHDIKIAKTLLSDILTKISHNPLQDNCLKNSSSRHFKPSNSSKTLYQTSKFHCPVNHQKTDTNINNAAFKKTKSLESNKQPIKVNGSYKKQHSATWDVQTCKMILGDIISKVACDASKYNVGQALPKFNYECFEKQNSYLEPMEGNKKLKKETISSDNIVNSSTKNSNLNRSYAQNYLLRNRCKTGEELVEESLRKKVNTLEKHALGRYSLPEKRNGFVDTVLPSSPITETVLPVYHVEKFSEMNDHLDCNSIGKECHDSELRSLRPTPARLSSFYDNLNHEKNACNGNSNKRMKLTKSRKTNNDNINCNLVRGKEGIQIDKELTSNSGLPQRIITLSPDIFKNGTTEKIDIESDSTTTVMDKVKAYSLHKNGCTKTFSDLMEKTDVIDVCKKLSSSNGCVQDLGPFKCEKCKRSYRTKESFEKHILLCDFVVDSSTDEEEDENSLSPPLQQQSAALNVICSLENNNHTKKLNSAPLFQQGRTDQLEVEYPYNEVSFQKNNINMLSETNHFTDSVPEKPSLMVGTTSNIINTSSNGVCHIGYQNSINDLKDILSSPSMPMNAESQFSNKIRSSILPSPNDCIELSNPNLAQFNNYNKVNTPSFSVSRTYSKPSCPKQIFPKIPQPTTHMSTVQQPLNIQPINQSINVHPINQSFAPLHQINNYNSIPIDQCGANVDVVSIPVASPSFQDSMNLAYGNPHPDVMQVNNGTLIFPQESGSQAISTINNMPVINGFPQMFSPTLDLSQNSQFSYVGSITITNSASMSLSMNMPGQIIQNLPMFPPQVIPQQNLTFSQPSLMQLPLQLQSNVQLSAVNVQQLTLQSACGNSGLAPLAFSPQTSMPGINSPVMFVEEAAVQSQMNALSSFNQSSNIVLQVPVGMEQQQQTCYQTILPNSFPEPPNISHPIPEPFSETIVQDPNLMPCDIQTRQPNINSIPLSGPNMQHSAFKPSVQNTPLHRYNAKPHSILPKVPVSSATVSSNCSSRSEKAKFDVKSVDHDSSQKSARGGGGLVDILKKAAQQMLSLAAKKKADKPVPAPTEEKKTRFAHTRKVAARKAQQLKNKQLKEQNGGLSGSTVKQPECLRLKISAIPTNQVHFSIPSAVPIPDPVPLAESVGPNTTVPPQQLDISHSIVIDESSQEQLEVSDDESFLLSLYNKKEKISPENQPPKDKPHILYEIRSEDGLCVQSHNIHDAWRQVYEQLQDARIAFKKKQIMISQEDIDGLQMMGFSNKALTYLLEQLPGVDNCVKYKFNFHKPAHFDDKWIINPSGCARSEPFTIRREYDMFNFLASEHRDRPFFQPAPEEDESNQRSGRRATSTDQPMAMRFRNLKTIARETVGVYRSSIHGRGLFCKRNIDPGELVIEYAGEVIRSVLTDKREQFYQSKGIGCYMFRIDDDEVVDATMHGNAARFINHSCEPNCFSKVITIDGKKHIVIFALRKILKGEELTYDYKFPFEEEKIPCSCNSRRCRKYLN